MGLSLDLQSPGPNRSRDFWGLTDALGQPNDPLLGGFAPEFQHNYGRGLSQFLKLFLHPFLRVAERE